MIELKTNPDHLHAIASNVRLTDQNDLGHDLDAAAHDLKNLRDYAEGLERNTHQMSGEIQSIRTQRDDAAAALLAIIRPELQKMIEHELHLFALQDATAYDDLNDRLADLDERLERVEDPADTIRDEVRDMVRDGEIVVTVDLA